MSTRRERQRRAEAELAATTFIASHISYIPPADW